MAGNPSAQERARSLRKPNFPPSRDSVRSAARHSSQAPRNANRRRQDLQPRRQRELEPVDPEVPEEPEEPEVPDEPEDFDEPLPDMPDDEVPLAPELWSLARRSQPANTIERAATINRTCEVLTSGFIVVPFIKMDNVSFLTVKVARSSSFFAKSGALQLPDFMHRHMRMHSETMSILPQR